MGARRLGGMVKNDQWYIGGLYSPLNERAHVGLAPNSWLDWGLNDAWMLIHVDRAGGPWLLVNGTLKRLAQQTFIRNFHMVSSPRS